jgi:hypothetical protein
VTEGLLPMTLIQSASEKRAAAALWA